jgi:hypothetical protein
MKYDESQPTEVNFIVLSLSFSHYKIIERKKDNMAKMADCTCLLIEVFYQVSFLVFVSLYILPKILRIFLFVQLKE